MEARKFDIEKAEGEMVCFLGVGWVASQKSEGKGTVEKISEANKGCCLGGKCQEKERCYQL